MNPISPNLSMPYLAPAQAQAQKNVTINEALRQLDAVVQLSVSATNVTDPPAAPIDGTRVIVGEGATGPFSGKAGHIAAFQDGAWMIAAPTTGWRAWSEDERRLLVFRDDAWQPASTPPDSLERLGINTAPDTNNRLSVSGQSTIFNHDRSDHRVSINRAGPADTASLVFQTGFSGRAEFGLAGENGLQLRSSVDGSTWVTRLMLSDTDPAVLLPSLRSGQVDVSFGEAVSIEAPSAGGFFIVLVGDEGDFPQINASAIIAFDCGSSPGVTPVFFRQLDQQ